ALLVLLSVVIVGYLAWRWFAPTAAAPTPVQRSNPKPTAAARSTRTKQVAQQGVAKPAPARPVTSQPRLAPEGTFFLLERASLQKKKRHKRKHGRVLPQEQQLNIRTF